MLVLSHTAPFSPAERTAAWELWAWMYLMGPAMVEKMDQQVGVPGFYSGGTVDQLQ